MIETYNKIQNGKKLFYKINYLSVACRECGKPVKISDRAIKSLEARGIKPICYDCRAINIKKYGREYNKKRYTPLKKRKNVV